MPSGIYKHKLKWDKILTKKFLIKEYTKNRKSELKISKEVGCSDWVIGNRLKKYNIYIRTLSEAKKGKKANNFKDNRTNKDYYCKKCGAEITVSSGFYGSGLCRSCSCKEKLKDPQNHSRYIDNRTNKQYYCIDCGKKLSSYQATRCKKCACKINGKKHTGENNCNYIDGHGNFPYSLEFNDKLKLKIRKRDNYKCQKCYTTEEEHITVYGQVLSVHHIDYNKENCEESNLITLCNECNLRVNYNRKYWKNYFRKLTNKKLKEKINVRKY